MTLHRAAALDIREFGVTVHGHPVHFLQVALARRLADLADLCGVPDPDPHGAVPTLDGDEPLHIHVGPTADDKLIAFDPDVDDPEIEIGAN